MEAYETYVTRCPVDLYGHAWECARPILDRDMTYITDNDLHKSHMMATYSTKECQNSCTFKGCRKHPPYVDPFAASNYATVNRNHDTQETSTIEQANNQANNTLNNANIQNFEVQEPQL